MKANELMIGDWVMAQRFIDGNPCQDVCMQVTVQTLDDLESGVDDVTPIPLTPEIMEKNGFWYEDLGWNNDCLDFVITVTRVKGLGITTYCNTAKVWVEYVHELQHALRLCGLNDFKI